MFVQYFRRHMSLQIPYLEAACVAPSRDDIERLCGSTQDVQDTRIVVVRRRKTQGVV